MNKNHDNIRALSEFKDSCMDEITELARSGARQMLMVALDNEVNAWLEAHASDTIQDGRKRRFVRNGYHPEREIQTGVGDLVIRQPKVRNRDRKKDDTAFVSGIVPPYLRRSKSVDKLLPLLYLKGISTGDFMEVLTPMLGKSARNVSPQVISRLKRSWKDEYETWRCRDLVGRRYAYFWADGIYFQARMDADRHCVLVVMGVLETGKKELVAIETGYRESKESWVSLLQDLKSRGLSKCPEVAVGDGALGFWGALNEVYPRTRHQRCWCHKTVNVLDKLPKSMHAKARDAMREIWMSESREQAEKAMDSFSRQFSAKYPKASRCLLNDREELLQFYGFPAEHWRSLRTTNPIESTFATVRHRTKKSRGCFSRETILTMVFKLCESAQDSWIRIRGFNHLAEVIQGVRFVDGVHENQDNNAGHAVAV